MGEQRWRAHKEVLALAARQVQERLFLKTKEEGIDSTSTPKEIIGGLGHISKVVWRNMTARARICIARCPLARHLRIDVDTHATTVKLVDPKAFSDEFDRVRADRAAAALQRTPAQQNRGCPNPSAKGLEILARLWNPIRRTATLAAIVGANGIAISEQQGIAGALEAHWSPTFTASHDDFPAADADRFLGEWGLKWRLEDSTPPCLDNIERCAKKAKKSAPGPDGLPYAAWREGGIEASKTLLGLTRDASSGLCHSGLNDQSLVFLPKDVPGGSDDSSGLAREPSDTRPLSLKNSDVKICTSAVNGRIKTKVKSVAHKDQRGFISGRQLLSNILLIDSKMRMHGLVPPVGHEAIHEQPAGAFFDFSAASPSVSHR